MCLLIVRFRLDRHFPLVVAANRDERYDRSAGASTVLREDRPRIIGGQDLAAGGTWLAVNEHGVVAGLTNQPSVGGRDPSKRSRGELPLALATCSDARTAVELFVTRFRPADFNPCWLLVGDRRFLFYVDMTGGDDPSVEMLTPGSYVLENRPLHARSSKVSYVRRRLAELPDPGETSPETAQDGLVTHLTSILADHAIPPDERPGPPTPSAAWVGHEGPLQARPRELGACCVHTEGYGTRSSTIVRVSEDNNTRPRVLVADGPPCTTLMRDVGALWG